MKDDAVTGRTFEVPTGDQRAVEAASPEISRIANAIGYALAERGVQFTAEDTVATGQRVFDQCIGRREVERPRECAEPTPNSTREDRSMKLSDIRQWLESAADELMRNREAEITCPPGVAKLKHEDDQAATDVDVGLSHLTSIPGPRRITFIAVLDSGQTIETVR